MGEDMGSHMNRLVDLICVFMVLSGAYAFGADEGAVKSFDVVVGCPGGIMAGVAVGRGGRKVIVELGKDLGPIILQTAAHASFKGVVG